MLVLTLFQCKVGDFFTRGSKDFDNGTNHFLAKRHLLGVIQILFIENAVSADRNWNRISIFLQNFFTEMEQILVLTLFQCNSGKIQILFIQNSVSEAKNCN